MNTEPKRLLKMLDVDAADEANPILIIGTDIEYTYNGVTRTDRLVDKSAFSVTVQQPTSRLTFPIDFTTVYKIEKDKLDMARKTADGAQPSRGRPKASQPPAMHPSEMQVVPPQQLPGHDAAGNLMLPPGSPQMPIGFGQGVPMPTLQQPSESPAAYVADLGSRVAALVPREVTIHQVQGDPDWINKAIEDMTGTLFDTLRNLVESVIADATEDATPEAVKTCFHCVHIDIEGNRCAKFNVLPPLSVIAAPEGKCTEFVDGGSDVPM